MAKKTTRTARKSQTPPPAPLPMNKGIALLATMGDEAKSLIAPIRDEWAGFAGTFKLAWQKRKEIAPKLLAIYNQLREKNRKVNMVMFVQMIDPTVPNSRDDKTIDGRIVGGYRNHPSYQAMTYCFALADRAAARAAGVATDGAEGGTGDGNNGATGARKRGVTVVTRTARFIATLLQVIANPEELWQGIAAEFLLDPTQLATLQAAVPAVPPLFAIKTRNKVNVEIIHMDVPETGAGRTDPERVTGTPEPITATEVANTPMPLAATGTGGRRRR